MTAAAHRHLQPMGTGEPDRRHDILFVGHLGNDLRMACRLQPIPKIAGGGHCEAGIGGGQRHPLESEFGFQIAEINRSSWNEVLRHVHGSSAVNALGKPKLPG